MRIEEQELIAYHLDELPPLRRRAVRAALERDAVLAAESEEIAATLRAFGSGPTPRVDAAVLERSWQRVRPSLAVLEPQRAARGWRWMYAGCGALAMAAVMAMLFVHRVSRPVAGPTPRVDVAMTPAMPVNDAPVVRELESGHARVHRLNGRPGPLTEEPAEDAGLMRHLDSAERLLTQVSHQEGPMPAEARGEAHRLLLENAVYQQRAQESGDYATANVMDDLGRVLVSLDAAPPETASGADDFRVEMNVGGVLFDLRILHSNKKSGAE